ncbi:MAG: transglycosylase SLT domain-containing protein [Trichodesmium sp. St16_bin4-tuft]|nr:transglycosylase SLT domain-containing protein [Trichodesmium sp. St5_bin8]MDE5077527.1 transglycosylase SLT domain-containing protein [Trichodesmium sp. St2_bin6]MDE5091545.1 transglycosylase SLT domain-containing protein [Trichodesmium sp. St18_bin3_1_1]MDE5099236.1 transglycosylase SLT domain-containing protein [Trichodesmium sp. St16_bin4-tuft]
MLKQNITKVSIVIVASVSALLSGVFLVQFTSNNENSQKTTQKEKLNQELNVVSFVSLQPEERRRRLETAIKTGKSLNTSRARYVLANDLIQQGEAELAIAQLKDLEKEYITLAQYILVKRAQAYEQIGDTDKAKRVWQEVLRYDPQEAVVVEALYILGKENPEYWDEAIAKFPGYPATVKIAQEKLKQNPNQPRLLLLIAKYGFHVPEYSTVLEQLRTKYASELTPEDWEMVAFGYWEKQDYGKGALAYQKATKTPQNLYRYARGLWLGGKIKESREAYKTLINTFPNGGEDTALGLIRLSRLVDRKDAIPYLDRVIVNFPSLAPEALLDKSKLLDKLDSTKSASLLRQQLLREYSNSDAAAILRWKLAEQAAAGGNLQVAWKWAQELTVNNPDHKLAAQASFWVGKWAQQLGRTEDATKAFEYMILRYPHSYYAWRSAVMLGWPVGDFTTVRNLSPEVLQRKDRDPLPFGSETLRELYQIGQDWDAWKQWQVEFKDRMNPTVAQQYTDGVLRVGVGDNLDGIWMLTSLSKWESPEEIAEYKALKEKPTYWQTLYPFPYLETIVKWSNKRKLNTVLVTALIRQESRFMPKIKSVVGATGLMQIMPQTGKEAAKKINLVSYDLENVNDNVNLGTYYLDFTHKKYKNNSMLAIASYNAGPNAINSWLKRFGFDDADAFVEKIPYPETRGYVESVFENYWNYLQIYNPEVSQLMEKHYAKYNQ